MRRGEGRTLQTHKKGRANIWTWDSLCKKVRNFLLVREEGKKEKMRMKCGLVMHQRPRLSI